MKTKACSVQFKAGPDDGLEEGEFIAYASVFGNKDSYGDVVQPGAFANTLKAWAEKAIPIPLLWGHNTADPDFNIGQIVKAEEDAKGLKVHARIDLESPKSAQVYRLLKAGRVSQMSFAFAIVEGEFIEPTGEGKSWRDAYYSLKELDLFEVSVVPIGANQETEILSVKAAASSLRAKAGRVLSSKNETAIRDTITQLEVAAESLKAVLPVDAEEETEDQDQTSGTEPSPGKSAQTSPGSTTPSPSVSLAALELSLLALKEHP
ncbi:HK97 family phage prohead protease [Rhodococcus erythropolis]|uniref:HK97 family phage prohead protease n=1 Tax=Rhodococcus TaxID=1827 RepID=UPI002948ED5D|nr:MULTISPECIES: HK97 family phage prohead protease [Rhodococcus]MDV6278204.1 HK97 family phage prohead protease [Rhodococcus erythropolis]MDV8005038.1 HK97 family phage prohead protease [Rhodococcus sp. IEGM 1318]